MERDAAGLVMLGAGCCLWAALHSLLLDDALESRLPLALRRWRRLLYCLTALVSLSPLAWFTWRLRGPAVLVWPAWWVPALLDLAALALGAAAMRQYGGPLAFVGLKPAGRGGAGGAGLIRHGVLGWVRHPLYLSGLVLLWGRNLDAAGLVAAATLSAYLLAGTWLEERRLVARFGAEYLDYRRRVPAFLPWRRLAVRLRRP